MRDASWIVDRCRADRTRLWLWIEGRHADNGETFHWAVNPRALWDPYYDFGGCTFADPWEVRADVVWRSESGVPFRAHLPAGTDDPRSLEARELNDLADGFTLPAPGVYLTFEERRVFRARWFELRAEIDNDRRAACGFPPRLAPV